MKKAFNIFMRILGLYVVPLTLIIAHVIYNETALHKISTDLKYGAFSNMLLFPTWEIAIIYGGLLFYFTKINIKNLQRADKYVSRGSVFIALAIFMHLLARVAPSGWLYDLIIRFLRFGSFIISIYVMSCGVALLVSLYHDKK